jgi:hypothetical protein
LGRYLGELKERITANGATELLVEAFDPFGTRLCRFAAQAEIVEKLANYQQ